MKGETLNKDISSLLIPDHIKDLEKSGLSQKTILEAGIKSVPTDQIEKKLGYEIYGIESLYEIPFDDQYSRFRIFYIEGEGFQMDGKKKPKYLTKKKSGNKIYFPPMFDSSILMDTSIPVYITEGEKKALKACQEGLNCIAIPGLWNWKVKDKNELIADFDMIKLENRIVYLVPDSDFRNPKKNLFDAVNRLGRLLIDKEVKVFWKEFPETKQKIGLDDYLLNQTIEDFHELAIHEIITVDCMIEEVTASTPQSQIEEIYKEIAKLKTNTEQAICIKKLSKKTGIGTTPIKKDINNTSNEMKKEDSTRFTLSAKFPNLVDILIDKDGDTLFMVKDNNKIHYVKEWEIKPGEYYTPPIADAFPFLLPRIDKVKGFYESDDPQLVEDLVAYFKRFCYLPDEQWIVTAIMTFLTYIQDHNDVGYLPMLLFYAVPERGKSRIGKSMTYASYRGIHLVEIRETNIFRYAQNMGATLFFDIMDLWKKAEKNDSGDILLLRYEKGAKVARVMFPDKGAFYDTVHYDIYGSTILATNEPIHNILDTRCVPITMPNVPNPSYEEAKPELGLELKERITAWKAKNFDKPLPVIEPIEGINGRLWDISKPMLRLCKLICPEKMEILKNAISNIAIEKREDKKEDLEGKIIECIYNLSVESNLENLPEWEIWQKEVLKLLNNDRPDKLKLSSQKLGKQIKAIGIKGRKIHGIAQLLLNKVDFSRLLEQYGIKDSTHLSNSLPLSTTPLSSDLPDTYGGGELVGNGEPDVDSLPPQVIETKELGHVVESGRVSGRGNTDKISTEKKDKDNQNLTDSSENKDDIDDFSDLDIEEVE